MGTAGYLDTPPAHFGIIPRAVHTLFQSLRSQPISQFKYQVRVSFLEIYNEDLIDLLSGADRDGPRPPITIREDTRGKIIWTGVREVRVDSAEDVLAQLDAGSRIRQVGATDMNSVSSRSHAIFSLTLRQENPGPGADGEWVVLQSKFHFVDLAGSERLKRTNAVGDRAKEGISINAGLSALGNVISVLGDPTKKSLHVPYRDSKLTRLLQDSLGGNSRTLMIACVSPAASNITETVNTLKYANRARNIKNKATLNESISSTTDVDFLQAQVARLKAELRKFKGMSLQSDDTDYAAQANARLEEQCERLQGELIGLQDEFELTQRELLKIQQQGSRESNGKRGGGKKKKAGLVEPVIEEYEKVVQGLEARLADAREALAAAEASSQIAGAKLRFEETVRESNAVVIAELKGRVAELQEREIGANDY
ncbi:MAG: P-loop containing nucleoside triphosphate hydrolase protein, partial [Piptocephalis tieghemiana]